MRSSSWMIVVGIASTIIAGLVVQASEMRMGYSVVDTIYAIMLFMPMLMAMCVMAVVLKINEGYGDDDSEEV